MINSLMKHVGNTPFDASLDAVKLEGVGRAHWNLPPAKLILQTLLRGEGVLTERGALAIETGEFTGRSPKDRFIVDDDLTHSEVDWGCINQPLSSAHFDRLHQDMVSFFKGRSVFVRDAAVGAEGATQIRTRVITEKAWSNLFVSNMFIRLADEEVLVPSPEWHIICAPSFKANPSVHGTRQGNVSAIDFSRKLILIAGSAYTGEIKKGMFSVMNFVLPTIHGVMPMHCSANMGSDGNTAVFFGLSGTGKTTLSSDPERQLIGDDEHGWGPNGIFNMEGGCYAKTIDLSPANEPQIYNAIRFGSMLENIGFENDGVTPDFENREITENTRVSYPLDHIPGALEAGLGNHPKDVFFLTCDAFGVLPPISRLDKAQAMYHFLSGYTAKVAGTEVGVTEPQATFSACFGAPFMPIHPTRYAEMLGDRMDTHGVRIWLVNTGWSGGGFGTGQRMKLTYTRAMIAAAMGGGLDTVDYATDETFGLAVPQTCPGVPPELLNPRSTWAEPKAFDAAAKHLANLFRENFHPLESLASKAIMEGAPIS
ncbi:MAG: phosphoenolpyruvate carboxykinase (ATP) [Flavobacteriales bacterium]